MIISLPVSVDSYLLFSAKNLEFENNFLCTNCNNIYLKFIKYIFELQKDDKSVFNHKFKVIMSDLVKKKKEGILWTGFTIRCSNLSIEWFCCIRSNNNDYITTIYRYNTIDC